MVVTVADPGDPTADPSKAWPADRRTIEVGTLTVQQIQAERDGPCRDINFDPTVLPSGMRTSDDPFPAARSSAYAKSYDLRTAEAKDYPRTRDRSQAMIGGHQRFTPLQRLLHWLMAVCILAMLFIGVGMVSTVMPKYLTLVSIHKPLGIAILVLALIRLALRLRYGAPPLPADLPEPMKLAAELSHYALIRADDRHAADRLGNAVGGRLSGRACSAGGIFRAILPQSDSLHTLLWDAHFYLAFAFFALILLHVAAALFHALVRRDGVFEAMASVSTTTRSRPPNKQACSGEQGLAPQPCQPTPPASPSPNAPPEPKNARHHPRPLLHRSRPTGMATPLRHGCGLPHRRPSRLERASSHPSRHSREKRESTSRSNVSVMERIQRR